MSSINRAQRERHTFVNVSTAKIVQIIDSAKFRVRNLFLCKNRINPSIYLIGILARLQI